MWILSLSLFFASIFFFWPMVYSHIEGGVLKEASSNSNQEEARILYVFARSRIFGFSSYVLLLFALLSIGVRSPWIMIPVGLMLSWSFLLLSLSERRVKEYRGRLFPPKDLLFSAIKEWYGFDEYNY